jgi:hypothetical protein
VMMLIASLAACASDSGGDDAGENAADAAGILLQLFSIVLGG